MKGETENRRRRMRQLFENKCTIRPCIIELFLPSYASVKAEVRAIDISNQGGVEFWRNMTWAYTSPL
jgi:hypothetical protein